jgi:DNA-binding transcriptional ArsR family regulator
MRQQGATAGNRNSPKLTHGAPGAAGTSGRATFAVWRGRKFLDICPYRNILLMMARAATTTDVFNAIAEPRRREIVDLLVDGQERAVGDLVISLQIPQPAVSKHLGVLRKVGIVSVTKRGQLRLYRLDADQLRPVHDWVKKYERFWTHHLDLVKQRAERKMITGLAQASQRNQNKEK